MPRDRYTGKWSPGGWQGPGRDYYGTALEDQPPGPPLWRRDAQVGYYDEYYGSRSWMAAGATLSAFVALGYAPVPQNRSGIQRGWDLYARGLRGLEEYSPAGIFRTFQLSNFFSQMESVSRAGFRLSAQELERNTAYRTYLARLIDPKGEQATITRLLKEGVELRGGKLFWGEGGVALHHAGVLRATPGPNVQARLGASWARIIGAADVMGVSPEEFFSRLEVSKGIPNVTLGGMPAQIIGGRSRREYYGRWANAWATTAVDRFNRLLRAPFEMEPFHTAFGGFQRLSKAITQKLTGVPRAFTLGVESGTATQMMGRLAWKYGAVIPAAYMGYKTLDWMAEQSDLLEGTVFDEGITVGLSSLALRGNIVAAQIAQATGLQRYRELQEEIAPGSTELSKLAAFPLMGALGGIGGLYGLKVAGMAIGQATGQIPVPDIFKWTIDYKPLEERSAIGARRAVEDILQSFGEKGTAGKFARRLFRTGPESFYNRPDLTGRIWRAISEPAGKDLSFKFLGKIGPAKAVGLAGALLGGALVAPFVPGALIPAKSPQELRRIYSGQQDVEVRRGRWWEFGRSPFEGRRVSYYRPHWFARMRMNARERGIWGEDHDKLSPIERWFKQEFTYDLEREQYYERPYPITGAPLEDVPLVGPVISKLASIFKPPRLMHTEEWQGASGEQLAEAPGFGARVATELGETPGGLAESPFDLKSTIGEQSYRLHEMIGLYGFAASSIKEAITGTPDWFDQMRQLESSRRMFGFERSYWDLELGGLMGTTEAFRRLYPHRRRQIPQYNPIRNLMPEWLPGPGEKAPDFLHGDPYTKVQEGELRLPGRGYAARFPELEGISPEDYPLIHRFRILADVAPYSEQFRDHMNMVRASRNGENWTDENEQVYRQVQEQLAARKQGLEFNEYKYLSPMGELLGGQKTYYGGEDSAGLIAQINAIKASQEEDPGIISSIFGSYWELLAHNAETALDQMTPVSPGAKLVHMRTPIETYERLQAYGTENSFWNHPVRDFFRPGAYLAARAMGYEGIPSHIERRREIEQYFDILKYVKASRLSNMARMTGDIQAIKEFEQQKDETLFGVNPFTRNYRSIFRALPRRERDYFNAFAEAETEEERQRIMQLVPENEKALYAARWKLTFADEVRRAKKADLLTEEQSEEADRRLDDIYNEARNEGFPTSKDLFAEYLETRTQGESYPDWYRRVKILGGLMSIPGPDWVGWHPSVDLEDIKLKTVMSIGEDMHDYDLWPSQAQTLVNKPYINDEAVQAILQPEELSSDEIRDRIDTLLLTNKMQGTSFTRTTLGEGGGNIEIDLEEDIQPRGLEARSSL